MPRWSQAMFGTPEGPWNLTRRIEAKLGPRLKVDAVIEVNPPRAEEALKIKRESFVKDAYKDTVILPSVGEFRKRVDEGKAKEPRAILVATPPIVRGGLQEHNNLEVQLNKLFPNAAIFLEKPVATGTPFEQSVGEAIKVGQLLEKEHKPPVSVGYVLRYLKAVQEMKKIIKENNLTVMATNARFVVAYELAIKTEWWNKDIMQGPVIEQATHICDLARYFGGDIDIDTVCAHALEAHEKPGVLSKKNFDESVIPDDLRIPRATSASWYYESGAVGTMLHAIALHGVDYAIELEVYADGYQLILADPFGTPALHVRRPGSDQIEVHPTPGDDPYQTEMNHFIDHIEGGPEPELLSTYEDAARTYELTWAIRNSSEEWTRRTLAKKGKSA
ncbi:NAD binding dehydrogenase [Kwoniella heveanensis BCC8398]|uniref:NAD binding dehydrogenase n=1 Tax=Kwoniella heveanensis BCC8398 TaxID=1296120 RepID=A0A1B9GQR1_9TREE|nr:NAD binding dehydrogenase [Kwoniella heveanensis BCC8398]